MSFEWKKGMSKCQKSGYANNERLRCLIIVAGSTHQWWFYCKIWHKMWSFFWKVWNYVNVLIWNEMVFGENF